MIPYTQAPPYYAPWGEDRWLAEHRHLPPSGVFVDIGAGDGLRGSNTLYFENLGWTSLCVDPDPRNHQYLQQRRCAIDTRAVSSRPGLRHFGMYEPKSSWSGLGRRGPGYQQVTVECVRLDTLLAEAGIASIDLMSIDVEGSELDVWHSFDPYRHTPGIVIIEYDDDDRTEPPMLFRELGEAHELVHRTPANLILDRTA